MLSQSQPPQDFNSELKGYVDSGWDIVSDGPSGVQLKAPRKMKGLDKGCLVVGAVLIVAYGVGLLLIAIALVDYYVLTPRETKFLPRG